MRADEVPIKDTAFRHVENGSIKNLAGFDRSREHKVFSVVTEATQAFVDKIGAPEVEEQAKEIHCRIKDAFQCAWGQSYSFNIWLTRPSVM